MTTSSFIARGLVLSLLLSLLMASYASAPVLPEVRITASRPYTAEPTPTSRIAPGEFVLHRTGSTAGTLTVYLAFEGSATPDKDYKALDSVVQFPAGAAEMSLLVVPVDDDLPEGDETVVAHLTAPPTASLPTYTIDPVAGTAKVVIHDGDSSTTAATIKITAPVSGAVLPEGVDVEVKAVAIDPAGYIPRLEFYLDGSLLDVSVITFIVAPPPGTPVYHSITWKSPIAGEHELVARGKDARGNTVLSAPVRVTVKPASSDGAIVSIAAIDPQGTELPIFFDSIDPVRFQISRTGPTTEPLSVFFSLHGTATPGADYPSPGSSVVIPAGSMSQDMILVPASDILTVIEPMETVGVRLEPSPLAGPRPSYQINPAQAEAAAVIYEQKPPTSPVVELVFPSPGDTYPRGQGIDFIAATYRSAGYIPHLDYYDGDQKIGSSDVAIDPGPDGTLPALVFHRFVWKDAAVGEHKVSARASLPDGKQIASQTVPIVVKDSGATTARIELTSPKDGATFSAPADIPIVAVAVDPKGYIPKVEFYANDQWIGVSEISFLVPPAPGTPITHRFQWKNVPEGVYLLTVRGLGADGQPITSQPVKIVVTKGGQSTAHIEITSPKDGDVLPAGSNIPITAVAIDPNGYIPKVEFYANDKLIGVSEIYFIRAPDPGTPITHNFLWKNVPAGVYVLTARGIDSQGEVVVSPPVKIVVTADGGGDRVVLTVAATDPVASESTETGTVDTAVFLIKRVAGPRDVDVPVSFQLSGSAINGGDYDEVKTIALMPAGSDSIQIVIRPIPDKAIEPEETVDLTLIPPACPAIFPLPAQCYEVGQPASARAFIRDNSSGGNLPPKVAVAAPRDGSVFEAGATIEIRAEASDLDGKITELTVSVDGELLGSSLSPTFSVKWENATAGTHLITATAVDDRGAKGTSAPVRVLVENEQEFSPFVERQLPGTYVPGVALTVNLIARPARGTLAYAVEDLPPKGWKVDEINHDGVFDIATGKVKFGPFTDAESRRLSYRLTPPAGAVGAHEFGGTSSAGSTEFPITGDRILQPGTEDHPADVDHNNKLTITEVTSYAAAWKSGQVWAFGPSPIPMTYVSRAGMLWKRGEAYHYEGRYPAPLCYLSDAVAAASTTDANSSMTSRSWQNNATSQQCALTIQPRTGAAAYVVEEQLPEGCAPASISDDGQFDPARRVIRWGLFPADAPRTLHYTLAAGMPTAGIRGTVSFDGQVPLSIDVNRPSLPQVACGKDGAVHLTLAGTEGPVYILESSSDLRTWTALDPVFLPEGRLHYTEATPSAGQRYYRLRTR